MFSASLIGAAVIVAMLYVRREWRAMLELTRAREMRHAEMLARIAEYSSYDRASDYRRTLLLAKRRRARALLLVDAGIRMTEKP